MQSEEYESHQFHYARTIIPKHLTNISMYTGPRRLSACELLGHNILCSHEFYQ